MRASSLEKLPCHVDFSRIPSIVFFFCIFLSSVDKFLHYRASADEYLDMTLWFNTRIDLFLVIQIKFFCGLTIFLYYLCSDLNTQSIVVFRKSPFSLDFLKSTKCKAVKFYRTSVYHYEEFFVKFDSYTLCRFRDIERERSFSKNHNRAFRSEQR